MATKPPTRYSYKIGSYMFLHTKSGDEIQTYFKILKHLSFNVIIKWDDKKDENRQAISILFSWF